jgi:hypothetical protein
MRASFVLAVLALACIAFTTVAAGSADPTWAICPAAPTNMKVSSATVTLVQATRNVTLVLNAVVNEQITKGAKVTISVTLGGTAMSVHSAGGSAGRGTDADRATRRTEAGEERPHR